MVVKKKERIVFLAVMIKNETNKSGFLLLSFPPHFNILIHILHIHE